ncbi:MAG: hypothetical protein RR415_09350 [Ruthenibacterium sp.]
MRPIKIFVVTAKYSLANEVRLGLALQGIRARCFTAKSASIECADFTMTSCIVDAIINTCDVVVVVGDILTEQMLEHIRIAVRAKKNICPCTNLSLEIERKVSAKNNDYSQLICRNVVDFAVKLSEVKNK